jgi:hypothetical protein
MSRTPSSPHAHRLIVGALTVVLLTPQVMIAPAQATNTAAVQNQLVPAYFYPVNGSSTWPALCSGPVGSTVIANPDSGPGKSLISEYADVIDDCRKDGQRVIGYVRTGYTTRDLADVKAEIDLYYTYYGIEEIFLDEMSSDDDSATRSYYRDLRDHIKAKGADRMVVGNPGWADESTAWHADVTDVVVVFENTADAYQQWNAPAWTLQAPATKIGHLIHTTDADEAAEVQKLGKQRNAGHIYITDDVLTNPWDTLPSYWNTAPQKTAPSPEVDHGPKMPEDLIDPEHVPPAVSPFRDVKTDHVFYKEIAWLASEGISTGWVQSKDAKVFRPSSPVSREAMAAFLYRIAPSL